MLNGYQNDEYIYEYLENDNYFYEKSYFNYY
jgi:hypothetical protein